MTFLNNSSASNINSTNSSGGGSSGNSFGKNLAANNSLKDLDISNNTMEDKGKQLHVSQVIIFAEFFFVAGVINGFFVNK